MAITEAAETEANALPGGRLPVPLLLALDETASACRWRDLPDLFTHYGSKGIVPAVFLQGWSQGVRAWGQHGMEQLWFAANIAGVGAGIREAEFLDKVSRTIGDHDVEKRSVATARGSRTQSRSIQRERILDAADLASLPTGRAVRLAPGTPATLVSLDHWSTGPHAASIRESLTWFGPGATHHQRWRLS